jgi:glycosyl transferase, family 25
MIATTFSKCRSLDCLCFLAFSSIVLIKAGSEIFFGIGFLLGLWFYLKGPTEPISRDVKIIAWAMFSFLALKFVSIAWAPDRWAALRDFGTHSHWLALLPMIIFFRRVPNAVGAVFNGLGISMLACAVWAIYREPNFSLWGAETRFQASTGNALILGAFATVCASHFCILLFSAKFSAAPINKYKAWVFYLSSVVVVVASWSRMPMITVLTLNLLVVTSFAMYWRGNVRVALLGALIIFASAALLLEYSKVGSRFRTAVEEVDRFNSHADQNTPVGIRMAMNQSAFAAVKQAPWFGSGAGSAMSATKESGIALFGTNASLLQYRHLHNQYLQILVEQGAVGLGLFVLVGGLAIRYFWQSRIFLIHEAGISLVLCYALLGLTNISIKQGSLNSFFVLMLALLFVMAEKRNYRFDSPVSELKRLPIFVDLSVYLINMDRSSSRLASVTAQLDKWQIPFERVSAFDGGKHDLSQCTIDRKSFERVHGRAVIRNAEIGCHQSHLRALKQFVSSGKSFAVILEDDIEIASEFVCVLEQLVDWRDAWDIVPLFHWHRGIPIKIKREGNFDLHVFLTAVTSSAAYVVSRRAAIVLLEHMEVQKACVDHQLFDIASHHLRLRGVRPKTIQLSVEANVSTIGASGADSNLKSTLWKRLPTLIYRIRNSTFRFYRGAVDFWYSNKVN